MERLRFAEWTSAEYNAVIRAILSGRAESGHHVSSLNERISAMFDGRPILLLDRGRTALETALRSFSYLNPGRNEVIFPAYICPAVVQAIERIGLKPVAVDVGPDLNIDLTDLQRHLSPRTLAVVAAHMYGAPAEIKAIEKICAEARVYLVDDAAQVVGVLADERPLGSFGTCGILSFSQSKTIVAGMGRAGGALIVNDVSLLSTMRSFCCDLSPPIYKLSDLSNFLWHGILQGRMERWKWYLARARGGTRQGTGSSCSRRDPCGMANALAAAALCQLDSLASRIDGRILVLERFAGRLQHVSGLTLPQYVPGRYLTRVVLLLQKNIERRRLKEALAERGVQTRLGYVGHPRYVSRSSYAAEVIPRLMEIPSHSRMSDEAIMRLADIVRDTCDLVTDSRREGRRS